MRFSTITALCAAPLALAGSLQAEWGARGLVDSQLSARDNYESPKYEGSSKDEGKNEGKYDASSKNQGSSKDSQNNRDGANGESKTTEIIIIWINHGNNAQNQPVNSPAKLPAPAAGAAAPATHVVKVGGAGGLVFTPDQVQAAVGDMVIFEFHSQNHTATQSAFNTPCDPLPGGMDTGFMPNPNNSISPAPQVAMQVTVATPLWFYCRQGNHCGKGMTFSINPTAHKSQAMFQQMAIAQKGSGSPSVISGGHAAAPAAAPASSAPPVPSASAPPVPAASAPPAANGPAMVGGTGQVVNGACECSCLCGAASFPNAAIQGVGAFGGISGALPMSALEA